MARRRPGPARPTLRHGVDAAHDRRPAVRLVDAARPVRRAAAARGRASRRAAVRADDPVLRRPLHRRQERKAAGPAVVSDGVR